MNSFEVNRTFIFVLFENVLDVLLASNINPEGCGRNLKACPFLIISANASFDESLPSRLGFCVSGLCAVKEKGKRLVPVHCQPVIVIDAKSLVPSLFHREDDFSRFQSVLFDEGIMSAAFASGESEV